MSTEGYTNRVNDEDLISISTIIDDMWKGLIKYWWILLCVISVSASAFYFYARRTYLPYYTASSTFTVNAQTAVLYNEDTYNRTVANQLGSIFPYVLTSDIMQKLVADDLGLSSVPGTIEAKAMGDSNIITLTAVADSGQLAYDILQSVIKNYPTVSEYVIGAVDLHPIDETGIPALPTNMPAFKAEARRGVKYGALASFVILLIYALTKKTIRKEEDLKRILNVAWLGSVPDVRMKKRSSGKQPMLLDSKGVPNGFIESVRTMRTRIEKTMEDGIFNSFLVTSSIAGEGKSTMAANLAISFAYKGYTTLLVDGDLRHPNTAEKLGIDTAGRPGFYELLSGKADLNSVIINYEKNEHLYLIPGGQPVASTAGLLASPFTKEVLDELKKTVDVLILDTPPSALMSDAAAYAQYIDGVVYIIRQDYAKPERIREGIEMFADTSARIIGCALNDASEGITGYGYGYGYGYGRLGGYGSGSYYRRGTSYGADSRDEDGLPKKSRKRRTANRRPTGSRRRSTSDQRYERQNWDDLQEYSEEDMYYYEDDGTYYSDDQFSYEDLKAEEHNSDSFQDMEMVEL